MIKQHTAQSLAKYLGKNVQYKNKEYILMGVNAEDWIKKETIQLSDEPSPFYCKGIIKKYCIPEECYPILKTYEKLIEPMVFDGQSVLPIARLLSFCDSSKKEDFKIEEGGIYFSDDSLSKRMSKVCDHTFACNIDYPFTPFQLDFLVNYGFGAIKDDESITGYVDLFGHPCVAEE